MVLSTSGSGAGNWQAKAPMPAARYTHAAATFNGLIHIVGGADLSTCSVLNAHDVYDPANDAWTSAAPMQVGRAHPSAAVLNDGTKDLLYVVGGASACSVKDATMEAYDPATNSWTYKASMPGGGRNSMGAAVIDNRLYVVGGIKTGEVVTELGEVYNPITDTWSPIAPMPAVRYAMAFGAIDGILYAAGGGNNIPSFTAVDAYDPATNSWSPRAPLSTMRTYVASTVVDGLLFAIGGQNAINLSSVEIYDPVANAWSAGPALPAPRSIMPAATVAGRIYLTGGGYTASNGLFGDTLVLEDAMGPTTTATPSMLPNGNGWNNGDVSVTLSAVDYVGGAGVASIVYSLSGAQTGGATVNGSSTVVPITTEGTTTIAYHAVDAVGNVESDRQLIVRIDKTPPSVAPQADQTVNATAGGTVVTFSPSASDALSGIVSVQTSPLSSGQLFPVGTTTITITAYDAAGNSAVTAFNVTVVQKTLVSISVSPSSASIAPGQNQTFQAIGHFSDGTTQTLPSGNGGSGGGVVTGPSNPAWSVQMTPPIDVNACATPQFPGPLNFPSQGILDQGGVIHTTWSPGTPVVNVDGTITASNVNLTLTCTNNPAAGSITATWNGTRYVGAYSFNAGASIGSVSITGWSQQAPMPATRFSLAAASGQRHRVRHRRRQSESAVAGVRLFAGDELVDDADADGDPTRGSGRCRRQRQDLRRRRPRVRRHRLRRDRGVRPGDQHVDHGSGADADTARAPRGRDRRRLRLRDRRRHARLERRRRGVGRTIRSVDQHVAGAVVDAHGRHLRRRRCARQRHRCRRQRQLERDRRLRHRQQRLALRCADAGGPLAGRGRRRQRRHVCRRWHGERFADVRGLGLLPAHESKPRLLVGAGIDSDRAVAAGRGGRRRRRLCDRRIGRGLEPGDRVRVE
jgi:N-acetylneuraminic acid mutarotase